MRDEGMPMVQGMILRVASVEGVKHFLAELTRYSPAPCQLGFLTLPLGQKAEDCY